MPHSRRITLVLRAGETFLSAAMKSGMFPKGSVIRIRRTVTDKKLCSMGLLYNLRGPAHSDEGTYQDRRDDDGAAGHRTGSWHFLGG